MNLKKYIIGSLSAIILSINGYSQEIRIDGKDKKLNGFICGESHSIELSDPQTWGFNWPKAYFIWQRSDNDGASWQNLPDRGEDATSIKIVNYDGTLQTYRVIIGETEVVANEVALHGNSNGQYMIPTEVWIQCNPDICNEGENRMVAWKEDFKSVPRGERRECDNLVGLRFAGKYNSSSSTNIGDGRYAVVSHSEDGSIPSYHWFSGGTDHTGNKDGGFLIINNVDGGAPDVLLYEKVIDFDLCPNTWYYFSLYSMCISGGAIGDPDDSFAHCNFTFEIIGDDGSTVLATNKSGDVPLSDYGISTWYNYGVSFNSGTNQNVTLRIYDSAIKNMWGNDMAVDDISLIACQKILPESSLSVGLEPDKDGLCGESTQLTLSHMNDWETLLPNVYCTWQTSEDGGFTWTTMPESGEKIYSVEVPFQPSVEGIRYRVIISKDKETGDFIAKNGYSNDPCTIHKISNVSTLTCHCEKPVLGITPNQPYFCTEPVKLKAVAKNNVTIDKLVWSQQDVETKEWIDVSDQQGYSITVFDNIDRNYCVVAWNDTCRSDTVFITVKAKSPEKSPMKLSGAKAVCENGSTTLNLTDAVNDKITWMKKEEGENDFSVLSTDDGTQISISPKGKTTYYAVSSINPEQCTQGYSDTITVTVDKPAVLTLQGSAEAVCVNGEVSLTTDYGTATAIAWEQKAEGESDFSEFATDLTKQKRVRPSKNTTYRVRSTKNGTCPNSYSPEVTVSTEDSMHVTIEPIETRICAGTNVSLNASTNKTPESVTWEKKVNGQNSVLSNSLTASDAPTQSCEYTVTAAGKLCPSVSQSIDFQVDTQAELKLQASAEAVCVNGEVDLTADYGTATAIAWDQKPEGASDFSEFSTELTTRLTVHPAQKTVYRIRSTQNNACPETYSNEVTISTEDSLHITIEPTETTVCAGTDVTLKATADHSPETVTWEKKVNGQNSVLSNSLTASDAPTQSCEYTVTAAGKLCPSVSLSIDFQVDTQAELKLQASAEAVCVNGEEDLTADYGTATAIAWDQKAEGTSDFSEFSTELTSRLSVHPAQKTVYRIRSTQNNACPETYSNEVTVSTEDSLHIAIEPTETTVCAGTDVTLKATADHTPETVTWEKKVNGQNSVLSNSLTANDAPTQSCEYTVTASGKLCPSVSQSIDFQVDTQAELKLQTSAEAVCVNGEVDLTADYGTATAIAWDQKAEGTSDFSEFSTELTTRLAVHPAQKTVYRIRSTQNNACPETYSNEVTVSTEDSLHIAIEPTETTVCAGTDVTLKATADHSPETVTWEKKVNGQNSVLSNSLTASDAPTQSCEYTVTAAGKLCPSVSQSIDFQVDTQAELKLQASAEAVCVNGEVNLTADYGTATAIAWDQKAEGTSDFSEFSTELTTRLAVHPAQKTVYRIRSRQNNACPETYSNEVTVSTEDSLHITIEPTETTVCAGTDVTLKATADHTPETVTWEKKVNGQNSVLSNSLTASDAPTQSCEYTVTAAGKLCPSVSQSIDFQVDTQAELKLQASAEAVCVNGEVDLSADYGTATAIAWDQKAEGTSDFSEFSTELTTRLAVHPAQKTVYRIRSTQNNACPESYSNEVVVLVEEPTEITLSGDESICRGGNYTINFHVKNGQNLASLFLYEAINGENINQKRIKEIDSDDYDGSAIYTLKEETTFNLKATPNYCPEAEATFTVKIDTVPTLYKLTASADSICRGELVEISTDFPFSENNLLLTTESEESYMTASSEQLQPYETRHYTLLPRTDKGCVGEERSLIVHVSQPVESSTTDTTVCIGEKATLNVTGGSWKEKYVWSLSPDFTDTLSTSNRQSVLPEESTTYYVQVTNGKCVKEMEQTVHVAPRPSISMSQENAQTITLEGEGGTGNYKFDLGSGFDLTNTINGVIPGWSYKIRVIDEEGCISDTTITAQFYELIIPEYFTPQNDGINDTWKIINLNMYSQVKVTLFDRHGKKLFESTDPEQEWDGTYNGHAMPSEDYWYIINVYDIKGFYTGHFTLIRN